MRTITPPLALALFVAAGCVHAQKFPERTVTVVTGFPAGGSVDMVARVLAQRLGEVWGQPVVVVNRPGAGGNIAAESVARAVPDGHTLLVGTTALAVSPSLYRKLAYDVLKDLAPVSQVIVTPNLLAMHPSVPARSVAALVALARSKPGSLNSASAGAGSSNHMALVLFNLLAQVDIGHVPYKGAAPAVTAVVGGEAAMTFVPINAALPLVQVGKLRALGVTDTRRSQALPDVPTIAEGGVPGYAASSWNAMMAPGGTPPALLGRIHAAVADALRHPRVADVLVKAGAEPVGNTPEEFARQLREEIAKWAKVVQAGRIEAQ